MNNSGKHNVFLAFTVALGLNNFARKIRNERFRLKMTSQAEEVMRLITTVRMSETT